MGEVSGAEVFEDIEGLGDGRNRSERAKKKVC
jgi:hypothetical protein